jgi:hypothetical protein
MEMKVRETLQLSQRECDDVDNEDNTCILSSQYAVEGDDGLTIIGEIETESKAGALRLLSVSLKNFISSSPFVFT